MAGNLRQEVLSVFKKMHKTRLKVFQGDEHALKFVRNKINEEYKKNKNITNVEAIRELIQLGKDVEQEVRTTVIQAVEKEPGKFELKITPDTVMVDNIPFGQPVDKSQFRKVKKCCSDEKNKK